MKIVILDSGTLGADINLEPIRALGDVIEHKFSAPDEVAGRLADADVAVLNKVKLNAENLANAKNLKLICVAATGYDNIDIEFCRANGIAVCNVPGYSTDNVAQLSVAMALSLVTHLDEFRNFVHSGEYSRSSSANRLEPVYHEIAGMTWGVVGGGGIGSKVAEIATALGCRVLLCRRQHETRYEAADIDRLCRECDIISLHVPLNDGTRGMISRERIASMKDGVVILNTARGAVCDEQAIADGVLSGKIGALGCDVYSTEPFREDHPFTALLDRPNVCLTPHMAWGSSEARNRCVRKMAENITEFCAGNTHNRIC
ncbi:MAG: hydroxyacid dehydrogenase [Clostridia bacterium]|nr:hydroxyacid dehydrogenase [Clostridia bacterium]